VENDRSSIATVQGMVDRILLVGAFWAGHPQSLATPNLAVKSPGPFASSTRSKRATPGYRITNRSAGRLGQRVFVVCVTPPEAVQFTLGAKFTLGAME
jgi:hypothetical protein